MGIGVPEPLIISVAVVVLFGPGRFGKILGEFEAGIRSFREILNPADEMV